MQTAPELTAQDHPVEGLDTVSDRRFDRVVGWYDPDGAAWEPDAMDHFEALRPAAARPGIEAAGDPER